jgi:2-dehydro-3-deoxyphosphogluconate aldolase/(4S)-4-hydroxy-2-oxoglutarate aldolase
VSAVARPRADVLAMIRDVGIVPVIRCDDADVAVRVAEAMFEAHLIVAEITMTVPNAVAAISKLARRDRAGVTARPLIGAGTVLTADSARAAIDAGAEFIVTPALLPDVIDEAKRAGVAVLPGALTPTEILAAVRAGGDVIKVFPVQAVGGASYIRSLRGPFPDLPLVPTGGVDLKNAGDFIRAGATAIGVGSELVSREDLKKGDYDAIADRAAQYMAAVTTARQT